MMNVKDINIDDFNYPLPDERIARHPLADRASCRLLMRDGAGVLSQHRFDEIPGLLPSSSMLVYNNTKVINARLRFRKPGGARIEIYCHEPVATRASQQKFAEEER